MIHPFRSGKVVQGELLWGYVECYAVILFLLSHIFLLFSLVFYFSFISAGKTSNAINLCSLELQQGRSVLYCSASAKPLKELFLRLPAEMRKICLDVSSLEYNDDEDAAIKDFCNRLECMQVDLNPMQNEEQKYNKKKEVCGFLT